MIPLFWIVVALRTELSSFCPYYFNSQKKPIWKDLDNNTYALQKQAFSYLFLPFYISHKLKTKIDALEWIETDLRLQVQKSFEEQRATRKITINFFN